MKPILFLILMTLLLIAAGCQRRGPEGTGKGKEGEELSLGVPEKVQVEQGSKKKFAVAVARDKVHGAVKITFAEPPEGLSLEEKAAIIPEDRNEAFFVVQAAANAKTGRENKIKVNATLGEIKATAWLKVEVNESLETRSANKEAYTKATEKRLTEIKKQLDNSQELAKGIKDDTTRSNYVKRAGELVEELGRVRKKFNDLVGTPPESWQKLKPDVTHQVNSLEKNAKAFVEEIKKRMN